MPAGPMATDGLLKLLAWLSPSFPVGAFAYSHALESAIDEGLVRDRSSLQDWIASLVAQGGPRADAVFFCHVYRAVADADTARFVEIAELAGATRGSGELALEATQQGESFFRAIGDAWPVDVSGWRQALADAGLRPAYPVAVATAAAAAGVPLGDALAAYLHAFAANLVSAAVRAIPLGQTDGQRVLAEIEPHVDNATGEALGRSLDEAGSAALVVDALSFRHETQYSRIFRS
ncbi:MAG: urease accessory protein UreF [Proteobacteria bacterium]|nr:urease accessory protein UreF [Pseudomonadota bacterium]